MNTWDQVQASIQQTIGRPLGGDPEHPIPGGPEGGDPNDPNNIGAQPQAPIILAGDTKAAGALPQIFNRSRDKADNFIEEVKDYL